VGKIRKKILFADCVLFYSFVGNDYRFYQAVCVKKQLINTRYAGIAVGFTQRAAMIDHVPGIVGRVMNDRMMSRARSHFRVLL
jgi:hypothetical protein